MSTTAEIRDALELAMARIGCPPGDNADADIYHRLSRALALLADMEGRQEPVRYGTAPGLQRNCSGCDFLSTPSESKHFRYCPGCGSVIEHPSPTAADAKDSAVTYAMSRDYEALYDLLCAGGEALGQYGSMNPKQGAFIYRGNQCAYIGHTVVHDDTQAFVEVCQQMNLEWIATVDVQEVIKAGDLSIELWAEELRTDGYDASDLFGTAIDEWTTATKPFRP